MVWCGAKFRFSLVHVSNYYKYLEPSIKLNSMGKIDISKLIKSYGYNGLCTFLFYFGSCSAGTSMIKDTPVLITHI